MQSGPDANFREPGGATADGFSTAPAPGPFDLGDPKDYARKKATQFPNERGPAVIAIEIPDDLAAALIGGIGQLVPGKALHAGTEIRFEPGGGLEPLQQAWPSLVKRLELL